MTCSICHPHSLKKIRNPRCLGDTIHNEYIDIILNKVDLESDRFHKVSYAFDSFFDPYNMWCFHKVTKSTCKSLNSIIRAKNAQSFQDKIEKLIHNLKTKTRYGEIFNSETIDNLSKLL